MSDKRSWGIRNFSFTKSPAMSHVFQIVTGIITGKIASVRDISFCDETTDLKLTFWPWNVKVVMYKLRCKSINRGPAGLWLQNKRENHRRSDEGILFRTEDSKRSKLITPVSERFRYTDDSCLLLQLKFLVSADKTPFSISLATFSDHGTQAGFNHRYLI